MAPWTAVIADYHEDCRNVYSTILQHDGFTVLEARTGAEALDVIRASMPDVVITEMTLPVLDGLEVLRQMREDPLTCRIAVVVVTADPRADLRQEAEAADSDAYLLKPCPPRKLLSTVRSVLAPAVPFAVD